jgi:hypothetical protein
MSMEFINYWTNHKCTSLQDLVLHQTRDGQVLGIHVEPVFKSSVTPVHFFLSSSLQLVCT